MTPPTEQSIVLVRTARIGSGSTTVDIPVRALGRVVVVPVPADGEEHVLRCDGLALYLDGEAVEVGEVAR